MIYVSKVATSRGMDTKILLMNQKTGMGPLLIAMSSLAYQITLLKLFPTFRHFPNGPLKCLGLFRLALE